jgi:hypothetical protein
MLFSNPLTEMDNTIRGAAHSMDAAVRGAANSVDSTLRGAANTAASVAKDAAKDVAASTFPRATEFTLEYLAKVSCRFKPSTEYFDTLEYLAKGILSFQTIYRIFLYTGVSGKGIPLFPTHPQYIFMRSLQRLCKSLTRYFEIR